MSDDNKLEFNVKTVVGMKITKGIIMIKLNITIITTLFNVTRHK